MLDKEKRRERPYFKILWLNELDINMDSKRLDWKLACVISSNTVEIRDVTVAS